MLKEDKLNKGYPNAEKISIKIPETKIDAKKLMLKSFTKYEYKKIMAKKINRKTEKSTAFGSIKNITGAIGNIIKKYNFILALL